MLNRDCKFGRIKGSQLSEGISILYMVKTSHLLDLTKKNHTGRFSSFFCTVVQMLAWKLGGLHLLHMRTDMHSVHVV